MEDLILKYLDNTLTDEELSQLLKWLESSENRTRFKNFTNLQHNLDRVYLSSSNDAYDSIKNQIKGGGQKNKFRPFLKFAAIFIVLIGVGCFSYFVFFQTSQPTKQNWVKLELNDGSIKYIKPDADGFTVKNNGLTATKSTVTYNDSIADQNHKMFYNTLSVPYGQTFSIVLSDGTKVNLNSGSSLRYPTAFSQDSTERQVHLDGEAFFNVSHDKAHPFIVNTADLDIQVLGTRFDVSAYREDSKSYAVLVQGKIRAKNPKTKSFIDVKPGYKVFYENKKLNTKQVNTAKYTGWNHGELVFIKDSFQVIQHKLERKYNVKIINNYPDLDTIVITGHFSDENIDHVLNTFKAYKDFDYTHKNHRIIISKPAQ